MSKSVIFVKNVAPEIKKYYEELISSADTKIDKQRARDILGNENKNDSEDLEYSWFSPKLDVSDCGYWHIDFGGAKDMVIAAWDSPTQIVIDEDKVIHKELGSTIRISCSSKKTHEKIVELISRYNLEVFTPNLGDVYYLKPGVVHRTNPKAHGKPRLVLRILEPFNVPGE